MDDMESLEEMFSGRERLFMQLSAAWDLMTEGAQQIYMAYIGMGKSEDEALVEISKQVGDSIKGVCEDERSMCDSAVSILAMGLIKAVRNE